MRQAIDEVIDGPRTGRWSVDQLEKTEKIYIGTKIEIVVRAALELERAGRLDTIIAGQCVDFKWSLTSGWEFPTEAVDEICLLIGARDKGAVIDIGAIRVAVALLSPGRNKDGKGQLSPLGRTRIRWIEQGIGLKPNFLSTIDPELRTRIMSGRSGQERIRTLFQLLPRQPIPRLAIETIARKRDPMRRLRADATDRLGGIRVLSARYERKRLRELGLPELDKDDFVGVPAAELDA